MKRTLIALVASTALGLSEESTKPGTNSSSATDTSQPEARTPGNALSTNRTKQESSAETIAVELPVKRVITAADGRRIAGSIEDFGNGVITFRRESERKTYQIQLASLSKDDQTTIGSWVKALPKPVSRTAAVGIGPETAAQRGATPYVFGPRYSKPSMPKRVVVVRKSGCRFVCRVNNECE